MSIVQNNILNVAAGDNSIAMGKGAQALLACAIALGFNTLAKYGIKEVYYYSIRDNFLKHYGYFIKN